jgi:hypothetical protein
MSWITHRAPTEEDGDGDGDVMVHRQGTRGNPKGYWAYRKWHDVQLGTPFMPYTEPKKVSDIEDLLGHGFSINASEEPLRDPEEEQETEAGLSSSRAYKITVNISFQE